MHYTKAMSLACFGRATTPSSTKGIVKSETDVENYGDKEFMAYWKSKAREKGIKYIPAKYKDVAILKSLLKTFNATEIKMMMDYIWQADITTKEGKMPYSSYGLFLLSTGWVNSIYNKALIWKQGGSEKEERGWNGGNKEGVSIDF